MNESDPGSEDFPFDYRTTNDRFQEKLRQAQELEADRQILNDLERTVDFSSEDLLHLQTQHDALVHQVQEAEEQVQRLRTKLAERRKRREYEAGIMKLTPEERADAMQVEYNDDDVVDKNVLFEYLIRIGSAPLPANAADMSGSNFVRPHAELRQKAMEDPEVLKQSQFGHIHFAKADNRTEESLDGTVRYCDLEGKAYEQAFSVSFQVREAKLAIHDLTFKVSLDFEMDVGPLLEQIKTESNLLAFFRLLVHYGKLDHLRSTTFASLKTIYASRDVPVEQTSYDTLMFRSPTQNDLVLTLIWQNRLHDGAPTKSVIGVCEQVVPDIRMESSGFAQDKTGLQHRLSDNFQKLVKMKGVLLAAQIIINAAFQGQ